MSDTKRIRELLARYEGTGVTYAKAAHAAAICALLPALLDERDALKAELEPAHDWLLSMLAVADAENMPPSQFIHITVAELRNMLAAPEGEK